MIGKLIPAALACAASLLPCAAMAQDGGPTGAADSGPINSRIAGDIAPVHDPVLVQDRGRYYVYGTGGRDDPLTARTSTDLVTWTRLPGPFAAIPEWAKAAIPGADNLWAPDLSYWNGEWHLYYSVSTFGSNRSAIGLATNPTLDPDAPDYKWTDRGAVLESHRQDNYNAIDPNHVIDEAGRHWLAFGSFWGGIQLVRLDPATGKPPNPSAKPRNIAARPTPTGAPSPIEAPFIIRHDGYFYQFVSYDYCCKGANSTYYMVVGRSKTVTGPYRARNGELMTQGAGTIVLRADLQEKQRFRGPGHTGILQRGDGRDFIVYHAYDKDRNGAPTLRISPIRWGEDGWPVAER